MEKGQQPGFTILGQEEQFFRVCLGLSKVRPGYSKKRRSWRETIFERKGDFMKINFNKFLRDSEFGIICPKCKHSLQHSAELASDVSFYRTAYYCPQCEKTYELYYIPEDKLEVL